MMEFTFDESPFELALNALQPGMNMSAMRGGRKDVLGYIKRLDGLTIFVIPMKKQGHI